MPPRSTRLAVEAPWRADDGSTLARLAPLHAILFWAAAEQAVGGGCGACGGAGGGALGTRKHADIKCQCVACDCSAPVRRRDTNLCDGCLAFHTQD